MGIKPAAKDILSSQERAMIVEIICDVIGCSPQEITDLRPMKKGMTNIVLTFCVGTRKYVYRHPGVGSEVLVDRGREAIIQKIVEEAGVDTTLVAMSVRDGWRMSRFVESHPFNYHNLNDAVRAVRLLKRLHETPVKVRWEFDVIQKTEAIREMIPPKQYGNFDNFGEIQAKVFQLDQFTKKDGIKRCICHGDCRDENFLINDEEIHLIDWEYSGYSDPGFDIGSYICGGDHTEADISNILRIYFGRSPNQAEYRHFIAYLAITGYFYLHWTMYKEFCGQPVGIHKERWYYYAKTYSERGISLYTKE